ncbi:MAG: glycosyltransferase family 2 protein [Chloroflexi bacterium]|nr:glycosyltransferase family 2 protein [Chloroflexota bacterium]
MPNNTLVSIVIPTWNGKKWLQKCLPTVCAQTFREFETVVVDNGSTDGTTEWISANFPSVRVICNPCNFGFGRATNQGIISTCSPYVVTLNNDTEVATDWLECLMRTAQKEPYIGMWASKMIFAEQRKIINSTGISIDKCGIAWDRMGGDEDRANGSEPFEVFGPCGGAALYSRDMLEDVGLFDEDFFAYHDDVDLAWRGRLRGWHCRYVPTAVVYHYHSSSTRDAISGKWRLLGRNKIAMILKNYPSPQLWWYAPFIIAYDLMMSLYALCTRGESSHILGRVDGLREWHVHWRKRMLIQQRRTMTSAEWERIVSPIPSPWAVFRRFRHLTSLSRSKIYKRGATVE